ncbi:hypothetical protein [Propioniciclava flava]
MSHSPATPSGWEPHDEPTRELPTEDLSSDESPTRPLDPVEGEATRVLDPVEGEATRVLEPEEGEPTRPLEPVAEGALSEHAADSEGTSSQAEPEATPSPASATAHVNETAPRTRRTPRFWALVAVAAVVLVALIAWAVVAVTNSNRERAITSTATTYLQSIAASDAQAALATLAERPTNEALLTGDVLRVSQERAPLTDIVVTSPVLDSDTRASVSASYKIGGRDVSTTLRLVGDGRTSWLLVDGTADLTLSAPTGLTVNGVPVTESTNPAFPGSYVVATNSAPTVIAQGDTTALLATPDSEPASLTVAAALSDEGRQTVLNTVKGRLDECLTATESRPANCPFGVRTDNVEVAPGSVRFALANDPWADFHPALDPATMRVTGRLHLSVDATATITQNGLSTDATQRLEADRTYTVALTQQPLAVVWS